MSLKEEVCDLFIAREQAQAQLQHINQQLQQKINELQKEQQDDGEGN